MESGNHDQLKKSAFDGMIWKFMERICARLVSLVVSIVLARLLIPDDYAPISIITIFFAFCNVFISGGMNASLIQKKDVDAEDYSTVLVINLVMAAVLYSLMFIMAPTISALYSKEILIPVIRIMSLSFFINALKSVLSAYTSSNLQFRKFFFSTIVGTVVSAFVGIRMALSGFGVWALVAQEMTNSFIDTFVLFLTTRMRFAFRFSFARLKGIFRYGWKIMVTSVISVAYDQINPLIVGIRFTPADLAFYNKGSSFPVLINSTISDTLAAVLFPVMSKVQDNKDDVLNITRRYVKVSSYIIFPIMLGLLAVADTFTEVLLTKKWLPAVPYMQIFAVTNMFNLIQVGNLQAIKAIGRSDMTLIMEILKKGLYLVVIVLFVLFSNSAVMLAVSSIVCTGIALVINTYPIRKLIGYSYRLQISDFVPNLALSLGMMVLVLVIGSLDCPLMPLLFLQIATGVIFYVVLSVFAKNENFFYLLAYLRMIVKKG